MGQGPQRFRHITTADSTVGPPHSDSLHRQEQAIHGNGGAMPFARRDEDRLTRSGRERPRFELHDELAFEDEKELVARLTMPAAVEPSGAGVEDRYAVTVPTSVFVHAGGARSGEGSDASASRRLIFFPTSEFSRAIKFSGLRPSRSLRAHARCAHARRRSCPAARTRHREDAAPARA